MLKSLELVGFKSFAKKTVLEFSRPVAAIVGPNGSGKSNIVEAARFALGEQSMKALRGRLGADLIFKGSKNLSAAARAAATAVFDNRGKIFAGLDFDEVRVTREVYPDGQNRYLINDTVVRLKDVGEALSSVSLGSSGHSCIISQGEADRILAVSARERREIVEDALGLKIYQYKIREAERKFERAEQNIKEVQSLRREIAPHLGFLKKQVEKLKRAEELRAELRALYLGYFARESSFLKTSSARLAARRRALTAELGQLSSAGSGSDGGGELEKEIKQAENSLQSMQAFRAELSRKLGQLEGALGVISQSPVVREGKAVNLEEVEELAAEIEINLDEAMASQDLSEIAPILKRVKELVRDFLDKRSSTDSLTTGPGHEGLSKLKEDKREIADELKRVETKEKEIMLNIAALRQNLKASYEASVKKSQAEDALKMLAIEEKNLSAARESFENELREAKAMVGQETAEFEEVDEGESDRAAQAVDFKKIEKIKIRLEDANLGTGEEVIKEYNEIENRDRFLANELADLQGSVRSLKTLIKELKETLHSEFVQGLEKINKALQDFFTTMFGGGRAVLNVVKEIRSADEEIGLPAEEEETHGSEIGIEVGVSLPHKKAKDLNMLSGGERALTSIALLFAMTCVRPPPFLILDETDAALDEANSRKYGDLLEKLSQLSQLILVTHNRETMSRAHVLYGVTIGADGASKILSVKLDEALTAAN